MSDIELVIKISEKEYANLKNAINSLIENGVKRASMSQVCLAILDGTPLPKGHGDLKDELDLDLFDPSLDIDEYVRELMAKHNIDYANGDDEDKVRAFATDLIYSCMNVIKTAPTIIESDKSESEDRE
jgi:hypothetical protein